MMVSNKRHNSQNKIVQSTGLKKAWIGTIAILKGLKYKLSFWTSLKSKTQLIQLTDRKTGMLKCWNVGIELSICDTTKSPPIYTLPQFLSMSENNCGIYWLDSFNSLTSHNGFKANNSQYQSPAFCWGDNFHSQILKRGGGVRKKMSAWGDLKSSCHGYLPGGLTMFLAKNRLLKIKYGFVNSISNVGLGLGDN